MLVWLAGLLVYDIQGGRNKLGSSSNKDTAPVSPFIPTPKKLPGGGGGIRGGSSWYEVLTSQNTCKINCNKMHSLSSHFVN